MSGSSYASAHGAPLIARLGGLSVDVLSSLSSNLGGALERLRASQSELAVVRRQMVDRLYAAIGGNTAAGRRRLLLEAKRRCFNGRCLGALRDHDDWPAIDAACDPLAARALALEDEVEALWSALESDFEAQRLWEETELARLAQIPFFRCGLAVASPTTASQSRRLAGTPPERYGRRERRLVPTVLRYVSRAAFKLSPFSTFTQVTLADFVEGAGRAGYSVDLAADGPARHRSLVRLRRHLLDRCLALLERYPPVRDALRVRVNDSIVSLSDGRSCYLRPGQWSVDPGQLQFTYREESLVKLRLEDPIFEELTALARPGPTYAALVDALAAAASASSEADRAAGRQQAQAWIDRLLDVGWLVFEPPCASDEGHLEARLLEWLTERDDLVEDPRHQAFAEELARLVELEEGLLRTDRPARVCRQLDGQIDRLLEACRDLAGLDGINVTHRSSDHDVYQDVWLSPGKAIPRVRLDRTMARRLLHDIRPLRRYAHLFDHRLELLRTLGELCRRSGSPVPLLELFEQARPYFQDYLKFFLRARDGEDYASTWNPVGLEDLEELDGHRATAVGVLDDCLEDVEGEGRFVRRDDLSAFLDGLPARFTTPWTGSCLFLQPASGDGSMWMLNRLKEGSGRFGSRYSPVMDPASRQAWTHGLADRGRLRLDGEWVELLDIRSIQGDTLNVRAPQTPKVLVFPGARCDLPARRRRGLGELRVHAGASGQAELRDLGGQRLLPVHLGVSYLDYMPTLVKFLCAFGPNELESIFPQPWVRRRGEVTHVERTRIGRLVLRRRSWSFRPASLLSEIGEIGDVRAFAAVEAWRRRHGVPRQVFLRERVAHPILGFRYRPQYLDFSSPSFVKLFRSALDPELPKLLLFEALPTPETFSDQDAGAPAAVEFLLDELALGPLASSGCSRFGVQVDAGSTTSLRAHHPRT